MAKVLTLYTTVAKGVECKKRYLTLTTCFVNGSPQWPFDIAHCNHSTNQ